MNTQSYFDLTTHLAIEIENLTRGVSVGDPLVVPPSAKICSSLELFLPAVLLGNYPEWDKESLDGIFVARAIKTGHLAIELVGSCILIRDQTLTPFLVDLAALQTADSNAVRVHRLMLGEPGTGALGISGPPCNSLNVQRLSMSLLDRIDKVAWSYTFEAAPLSSSTDALEAREP